MTRVEVIAPISFKGDSRRWRTNPLNRQSQPICNVACNPLIRLPISNIQCPYTQDPCHTRSGCGRLAVRGTRQPRHTPGISRHSRPGSSAPRHVSARITRRWPRLRCGRVSPMRFSLTGAAPSSRAPADRPRRRAAKRKTLFIMLRDRKYRHSHRQVAMAGGAAAAGLTAPIQVTAAPSRQAIVGIASRYRNEAACCLTAPQPWRAGPQRPPGGWLLSRRQASPGLFSSLAHPFQQFGRSGDAGIEWHALWAVENHFVIAALHSIEDPLS